MGLRKYEMTTMTNEDNRPPTAHAWLNHATIRCFRDTADADYISARLSIRSDLPGPFLSSAEQAIEKYLKCILMLNRIDTRPIGHKIDVALKLINESLPFNISLDKDEQKLFDQLVLWDFDRYLVNSLYVRNESLMHLDRLVWKLRQYCRPLDMIHRAEPPDKSYIASNIEAIEAVKPETPKKGHVPGGLLERVLASKIHRGRDALVWNNLWYSSSNRNQVQYRTGYQAINSPFFNKPELADEASKYMKLSKSFVEGAKQFARKKNAKKKRL